MLRQRQYGTDTRNYCSVYDQLPRNVYKCTFPMTNDLQPQQTYFIKVAVLHWTALA